ncbi:Bug family tripartite tricarboxylate transporter substrate binding protein [Caldimonas tepidiphila]|uniref:Bug family tripartite tricarboxylate transporter substrate binding protein n=1 Tax=Caldimonas tepidiphila TaxID=2315841 RepID=UPI000E5C20C6|nr:tripartite tricarboxylate transporter substrate binding protein [Caldimonas tepidiphila]
MPPSRLRRALLGSAAALPLAPLGLTAARAESFPARPIRWIVAYPAGGGSDFLARQLAPQLGRQLGQTVVIENRPGAAGIIGTELAARAPADGHTWVLGDNGAMVFNPALYRKLPYSPQDFAPVGFIARFPLILVAHPGSGFESARQLLAEVKRNPGRYSYASPGAGSPHHLAMELLKDRTRSFIVHVPYRGTAMAIQDVIGGQVPMMVVDTAGGLAQIRAGRVRPLAVLSRQRLPQLPEVPTLEEAGVKDLEVFAWLGLYVPRGTPPDIVGRLSAEMQKAVAVPEVRAKLEEFGLQVAPSGPEALARFVERESAFWQRLIRERQLNID